MSRKDRYRLPLRPPRSFAPVPGEPTTPAPGEWTPVPMPKLGAPSLEARGWTELDFAVTTWLLTFELHRAVAEGHAVEDLVATLRPDVTVRPRTVLAAELEADGLPRLARQALTPTPPGALLVWSDDADDEVGFLTFDDAAALLEASDPTAADPLPRGHTGLAVVLATLERTDP